MLFTSMQFVLFAAAVLLLFYLLPRRGQRIWLLVSSYVFYMWWEPKFGLLLLAGTVVTHFAAQAIQHKTAGRKNLWLVLALCYLFGQLAFWKYADFLLSGISWLGRLDPALHLGLIAPVGISFYTFAAAGYLIDIYRGKVEAATSFLDHALLLSFFPSILSGPIPKGRELLPQFRVRHTPNWSSMRKGAMRFAWGVFKKLVVASLLSIPIEKAYAAPADYTGGLWVLVVFAYTMYLYLDFASYSDMAIGVAWMLGFTLPENFNAPFAARTVRELWRRWHMSLNNWFTEYLYFPLGGSRVPAWRKCCNVMIVFAVSGLWHGAAATFLIWGILNGAYQVCGNLTGPWRRNLREKLHIPEDHPLLAAWQMLFVFGLLTVSFVYFRAPDAGTGTFILKRIALILRDGFGTQSVWDLGLNRRELRVLIATLLPVIWEDVWKARGKKFPAVEERPFGYCIGMAVLLILIAVFGAYGPGFDPSVFTYFKF